MLERYPDIRFVFTEQGSAWIPSELLDMDYSYTGSYYRTDYKDFIRSKPSAYFARQCYVGASIFSQAEVAGRHTIGLDRMMLGMDFPHHEGTLLESTPAYLRATLGASAVPLDEARLLLGETAAAVFGFDLARLAVIARRVGPRPSEVLSAPSADLFPRGDVHRPAMLSPMG